MGVRWLWERVAVKLAVSRCAWGQLDAERFERGKRLGWQGEGGAGSAAAWPGRGTRRLVNGKVCRPAKSLTLTDRRSNSYFKLVFIDLLIEVLSRLGV